MVHLVVEHSRHVKVVDIGNKCVRINLVIRGYTGGYVIFT
jgi:hypothetical protein